MCGILFTIGKSNLPFLICMASPLSNTNGWAVGLGTILGTMILFWYDGVAPRLSAKHPTKREEYLRLPLVCVSGPVYVVSMLWLGWSARPDVHWFVPLASMVPYGLSYHVIYVAVINVSAPFLVHESHWVCSGRGLTPFFSPPQYVTDAYGIYSASALAAMSMTRSGAGALLPLAIEDMVEGLGIAWSCTLLAGVSAVLSLVPFGFIAYGEKIRAGSKFSAALKPGEGQGGGLGRVASLSVV